MHESIKISARQLMILAAFITIGDSILVLPAIPALLAKRDAWISALIGLAIGLLIVYLFVRVGKLNPKLTYIELNKTILGKWIGTIVAVLSLGYVLLNISTVLRGVGDFTVSQIMPDTPIEAIFILLLLLVIMGVRLGLETIARVAEIFFPWFILLFIILVVSLAPAIDIRNVQPVFDNGIKPILHGSIACAAFPFMELIVLMSIFPHVNRPEKIGQGIFIGALLGGIMLFIIISLSILVMGVGPTERLLYPSYDLAKRINIGDFFQRIEAILALLWLITVFFKLSMYLYAFSRGISQLFKLKDYRMLLLPIGMSIIVFSLMIAPNIIYYNKVIANYWAYLDMTVSVFLPMLLIVVYAFRKNGLKAKTLEKG